ncbi:hypothetical protein Tco_0226719 [Tanacetum coccineum]
MANLEFCDKHNMVAYLKKPSGSEGFQEIVDFLNGSHIRYALTKNPTIYVSLIKKFWQTATVRTVDNGEQEITATVDGKEFTVTEASVRRHLQLADVDGFSGEHTPLFPSMLAIQEEEGKGSGHPSEPQPPPSTAQPINEEPIPNVVSSSHQKTQTPRQALNKVTELPQTSEPIPNVADEVVYEEWDDRVERATTTAASLDANKTVVTSLGPNLRQYLMCLFLGIGAGGSPRCQESMGGSIAQTRSERVPTKPYDSPLPRVHTLGSDEGSMTLQELTALCTKLFMKVESFEADLKQTKNCIMVLAYTKLHQKVKKLEKTVKTSHFIRRAKIVVSDDEEDSEDSSKQGRMIKEIDQDGGITLVTPTKVSSPSKDQLEDQLGLFSTAEESVSTAGTSMPVSTAGMVQEVNISIPSPVVVKDKVRLQEELDEEERQRMARVYEAAQSFTEEEWENIKARVEADEELSKKL